MKNLLPTLVLLLSLCGIMLISTAPPPPPCSCVSHSDHDHLIRATAENILQDAAPKLGLTHNQLIQKYDNCQAKIQLLSPKEALVKTKDGGGAIVILDGNL